ncbi:MAG: hypothetical protein Q9195_006877 [Heterodermia aff. obscurata]
MDNLRREIKALRRKSTQNRYFVPERILYSRLSDKAILEALVDSHVASHQREEVLEKVVQKGRKIFGILILAGQAQYLSQFIQAEEFEDARLPFEKRTLIDEIGFPKEAANDFEEKQWEMIAPRFARGTLTRRFRNEAILPFASDTFVAKGHFGDVYETVLDTEHQDFGETFPRKFARKEMPKEYNSQQELNNLAILNQLKHPNIVELLTSYTHDSKHNILFPFAATGNLAETFATSRESTEFLSDSILLVAFAELASGLEHVHHFVHEKIDLDLIGCHHDLRPRNILVSDTRLILADFGLSTFKQSSENSETPFKLGVDDYLAPECEDWENGFQSGRVHRSVDIWAFGCILVEAVAYLVHGHESVKAFRDQRHRKIRGFHLWAFFESRESLGTVVEERLSKLEVSHTRACATLIRLARKMLSMTEEDRPKAKEVTIRLQFIALMDITTSVKDLFGQIRKSADSLDVFLEHKRFESWSHAAGIDEFEGVLDLEHCKAFGIAASFGSIVNCLTQLREDLSTRSHRKHDLQYLEISNLISLNDQLHVFLDQEQQETARTYFRLTVLESHHSLMKQIHGEYNTIALDKEIRMRAILRQMSDLVLVDSGAKDSKLVDPSNIRVGASFGQHSLAELGDKHTRRQILVEWRHYINQGSHDKIMAILYDRVASIVQILSQEKPDEFRSLPCGGYYHDEGRAAFGIIFDIPRSTEPGIMFKPTNLKEAILKAWHSPKLWPDLDDRYQLARMLSRSLFELHSVKLLHKNLTAENIAFFPEDNTPSHHSIREPFLIGFTHSRPDDPLAFTEANRSPSSDYQHPTYIKTGRGYQLEYDYFSLGIVLIELGFWKPYSEIIKGLTCSYEDRPQKLLDRIGPLRRYMGRDYYEAVKSCIAIEFCKSDSGFSGETRSKDILLHFEKVIIRRLSKNFT